MKIQLIENGTPRSKLGEGRTEGIGFTIAKLKNKCYNMAFEPSPCKEYLNDLKDKICDKLEKQGYDEIDYLTSDEALKENIDMNEYRFEEDGEMF